MSKPIAYATTALGAKLYEHGIIITGLDALATLTVREFLEDARREGRFDNGTIDKLLADLDAPTR